MQEGKMKLNQRINPYSRWDMPGAIEKVKMYLNKRDKFTGLYNRNYFFYCLGQKKNGTFIKIKFMGINFINLNSGIKTGDEIIQHISKTLKNIRANCIASRLSGTKFGLYTEETEINYIRQIIEEIITITNSISNNSDNIKVSASIGAVIYNNNDFSIKDASNKLEISLSNCIRKGNNKYEIYNEKYEPHINIESIEKSIESGEITLYYQPKVDVKSKKIKGVEALIRWFDEEYGYITPNKLIGFAENTGYISSLGRWIIRKACEEIKELNDTLDQRIDLSVNISPYQLEDEKFLNDIKDIVKEIGFDQELLKLEITENENMESIDKIHQIFKEIKSTGIKVSIDDFGKGYNSIDYIKNYNVDEIKIDKSLVEYLENNPLFIKSLINMIHTTNAYVVAEGVERKVEYDFLERMGCDFIQGYYCYKPMSFNSLLEIIKNDTI